MSPQSVGTWRVYESAPDCAEAATERLVNSIEHDREGEQAVVDAAVVELTGQVTEQPRPVTAPGVAGICTYTRRSATWTADR